MNSKPWYEIIRKDPFNNNEDTVAYLYYKNHTKHFTSKDVAFPIYKVKRALNPPLLEKSVMNNEKRIIASFKEETYLKEYLERYSHLKVLSKNQLKKIIHNFPEQLKLF